MSLLKWIAVIGLGLVGLGSLGFGVMAAAPLREKRPAPTLAPKVGLREFPGSATVATAKMQPTVPPARLDGGTAAQRTPDAGRPAATLDAGKAAAVDAGKPTVDAGKPDAGLKADAGRPDAGKAAEVVVRPPPPPPPPRPALPDGLLNLRASDTADIYLDGRKIGASPLMGLKVKAGVHKVRFDCYDAAGNTTPGQAQSVTVAADENKIVEFTCPVSE